jgi:uncharacterized protein
MKLILDNSNIDFRIRAYRPGEITVNDSVYTKSLLITAKELIADWPPQAFADFQPEYWSQVLNLKPGIVLFGTGEKFQMPKPSFLAPLYQSRIPVESMDTAAACRTFMALTAEGRSVLAALLIR